jgi:HlyD family secretion protein
VVVLAPNPEMKLLPGMTAKLSFQVDKRENAVRIPNAALRFYPKPYMVHPSDRPILEGTDEPAAQTASSSTTDTRTATQRVEERKKGEVRYVWVQEGQWLRAVEVTTGLKDNKYTELLSGDVAPGKELVTGLK